MNGTSSPLQESQHGGATPMTWLTLAYGLSLIVLGLGSYFGTGGVSITALIPTFFGVPVVVAGLLARKESYRMHAIHIAVLIALLGIIGTTKGLIQLPAYISGEELARPAAVIAQSFMALLSVGYFLSAVKSFVAARIARS